MFLLRSTERKCCVGGGVKKGRRRSSKSISGTKRSCPFLFFSFPPFRRRWWREEKEEGKEEGEKIQPLPLSSGTMTAPKWVREKGKGNTEKSPNKKEIHLPHLGQSLFLIFQSFQFCLYFVQSIDMFGKFTSSISFLSALSPLLFLSTSPFFPPPLGTVLLHGGGDRRGGGGKGE